MGDRAPDFSPLAAAYVRGRPTYPAALYEWLAGQVERHELAWDCATGNGQAAVDLAVHFERVVATDISAEQIAYGLPHPRVEYRQAPAEASELEPSSVDLVTVAAAAHWFDLAAFGREVRRVTRPGGVLAVWSYHAGTAEAPVEELVRHFYWDIVQPCFAPGAKLVDEGYRTLELPGTPVEAPPFTVSAMWTRDDFLATFESWSGVANYRRVHGSDPVALVRADIDRVWGGHPEQAIEIRWPLMLRVQRL